MDNSKNKGAVEDLDVYGEIPMARFGHTITLISKNKVVLFGGATGDTGKYAMTGDTFVFNILTRSWQKIEVNGTTPSPRAAHASTCVEAMHMVVYGGATGGGSLASDDLYLLDMRNGDDAAQWMIVPVVGSTPGRRYGHTIVYVKPNLIVFGGNTGTEPVNDVWCLCAEKSPFSWEGLQCGGDSPAVRVYHSAALCQTGTATGMMVIFGGRTGGEQQALNDTWGFRRHRDKRWDWVKAPYKSTTTPPIARYQHSTLFLGTLMVVVGGRTNDVGQTVPLEVYDTESSEWYRFPAVQRFRHACWSIEQDVYIHGGFEHNTPNVPTHLVAKINTTKLFSTIENFAQKAAENNTAATGTGMGGGTASYQKNGKGLEKGSSYYGSDNNGDGRVFRLSQQAHIASSYNPAYEGGSEEFSRLVRKISIDKLPEESKKLGGAYKAPMLQNVGNPNDALCSMFINTLLKNENIQTYNIDTKFPFKTQNVLNLIAECQAIVEAQPAVLNLGPPIKIFGCLYGQYHDLLKYFELWKSPTDSSQGGDIDGQDYLFLGDYVDRGLFSLETICLLMALKVKYPAQIHLLRGHHEDRAINEKYGLADECVRKLGENITDPKSVFQKLNNFFCWLPLAAVIDKKIICVHGGIGSSVGSISDIDLLKRPIEVEHTNVVTTEQQLVIDLLCSDPTDNEELGIKVNPARNHLGAGHTVKYGPDRMEKFLKLNNLELIIRTHECIKDGFQRDPSGQLITVFSALDFCGNRGNYGAILVVQKNYDITPKVLMMSSRPSTKKWSEDDEKKRPQTPSRSIS